jgi:hypothetical protein
VIYKRVARENTVKAIAGQLDIDPLEVDRVVSKQAKYINQSYDTMLRRLYRHAITEGYSLEELSGWFE